MMYCIAGGMVISEDSLIVGVYLRLALGDFCVRDNDDHDNNNNNNNNSALSYINDFFFVFVYVKVVHQVFGVCLSLCLLGGDIRGQSSLVYLPWYCTLHTHR